MSETHGPAEYLLGRRRRRVNALAEANIRVSTARTPRNRKCSPSPTSLVPEVTQRERGLDDVAQWAVRRATELRVALVAKQALSCRAVPSSTLVALGHALLLEVATGFDGGSDHNVRESCVEKR